MFSVFTDHRTLNTTVLGYHFMTSCVPCLLSLLWAHHPTPPIFLLLVLTLFITATKTA